PVTNYKAEYIPAYLSNGLIGLRAGRIPLIEGLAIVNGLAAVHPVDEVEGFSRGPYPLAGDISLNGTKLSEHPERGRFIEQRYDFSCGELRSRFAFEVEGVRADAEHLVFCSRTQPTLVLHELRVTANRDCDLAITIAVDPKDVPGSYQKRETGTPGAEKPVVDGSLLWECHGGLSTCGAAYLTFFEGAEDAKKQREEHDETAPLRTTYSLRARTGTTQVVRTIASLIPSQSHSEPHRQATRMTAVGAKLGFDRLRQQNREAWNDRWRGRVELVGAGRRWQALAAAHHARAARRPLRHHGVRSVRACNRRRGLPSRAGLACPRGRLAVDHLSRRADRARLRDQTDHRHRRAA